MWRVAGTLVAAFACAYLALGGSVEGELRGLARGASKLVASGLAGRLCALMGRLSGLGAVRRAREGERRRLRAEACERQMPELLDILGLGLTAGLSFDASLELYCARRDGELAHEMRAALRSWQMGLEGRAAALEGLAARAGSRSLRNFAGAVGEALSFGAPLATTLERQASGLREEQRALTQQRVEEAPVRMIVPLGTLVVPAMLLAILGPLLSVALAL